MGDMFDYLKWRGDISFSAVPPTPVDALIFSSLVYVGFDGIVPATLSHPIPLHVAADAFLALPNAQDRVRVKSDLDLLRVAAEAPRLRNTGLAFFRNTFIAEEETQFAAMAFLLDDGTAFLAFRGTDNSLVGWKEDFNMSFQDSVPAQREAASYLISFAAQYTSPLRLGGHSKGGNLAVYAAAKAPLGVQRRIQAVYNLDGPGFHGSLMGNAGYLRMVPKIHTYIPESSIIGILLEHEEPYTVIKSRQISILQHEPYSWEIQGGDFIHLDEISAGSRFADETIKSWIADMTSAERETFVDAIYALLSEGGVSQVSDLLQPKSILAFLRSLKSNDATRRLLTGEMVELLKAAGETLVKFRAAANGSSAEG